MVAAAAGAPVAVERFEHGAALRARGRDGLYRATTVTADRPAERLTTEAGLRFALALPPGGEATIALRYGSTRARRRRRARDAPARRAGAAPPAAAWLADRTSVVTDDELFNHVLRRSLLDIRMLRSRLDGDEYYAAGVPWFATLFGRDSLICAPQLLAFDPPMAEQTLRVLARLVPRATTPSTTPSPGRCCTSCGRRGRAARALAARALLRHGRRDAAVPLPALRARGLDRRSRALRGAARRVEAMLGWIDGPGDRDGDGLLEYAARARHGPAQPGLEGLRRGRARRARHAAGAAVTLVEPQGYALRAKRRLARLFALAGEPARADALRAEAAALGARLERFWLPDRGTTRWASAPTAARARRSRPTRGTCCGRARVAPERAGRCATR